MKSANQSKISDFSKIRKFEKSTRGDFDNLGYNPTFKSSAIFFCICKNYINTKISFLNYWSIKNRNSNVTCMYTLRDENGKKIYRKFFEVKENIYSFSIKKILEEKLQIKDFIGSIEFEIFSNFDLKFSYPAINAIYETDHGISLIHTNQRIMSEIQDNSENESLNTLQTGFDIYCDKKNYSFLTAINGPIEIKNKKVKINFFNHKGQKLNKNVYYKSIKPFQVLMINLDNFKDLHKFLNNYKGFCKVDVPTKYIFNRILAGTFSRDKKKITTTHSYYDCSNTKDFVKTQDNDDYSCSVPFNLIKGIDLEIVIYPIFSKCNIEFDLEKFSQNGERQIIKKNILKINKNFKKPLNLLVNNYIKNDKNFSDFVYSLSGKTNNHKIPARMTYGFNYKENSFGSNICDSMRINIRNKNKNGKRKNFYWGPVFNSKKIETVLALCSLNKDFKIKSDEVKLKIYDKEKILFLKKFKINTFEAKNININKYMRSYKKKSLNEILWFTLESSSQKNFTCKHVHRSSHGHISADHSF